MILEPWPHIIIDDFLSTRDLISLQLKCGLWNHNEIQPYIEKNGDSKGRYYHKFKTDPLKNYNILEYFKQFEQFRPYNELGALPQLIMTPAGRSKDSNIHEDAPHKVFTIVLYLAPMEDTGTQVYDADKNHVGEVEWKPNRALMFCPVTNLTWHSYGSITDRYTLMYNLVDVTLNSKDTIPYEY